MNIIGEVAGRTCILVDDIVDSGGTLCNAADALLKNGAQEVHAYITHGVLSGGAVARNIRVISVASLMGEAIGRTALEASVSSLFD
jgi:ribose-phosphate pyrophosphokinase